MAKIRYWKDIDVLDITLKKGEYEYSEPVAEDVVLDISESGEILSVEIHHVARRLSRPVVQSVSRKYMAA